MVGPSMNEKNRPQGPVPFKPLRGKVTKNQVFGRAQKFLLPYPSEKRSLKLKSRPKPQPGCPNFIGSSEVYCHLPRVCGDLYHSPRQIPAYIQSKEEVKINLHAEILISTTKNGRPFFGGAILTVTHCETVSLASKTRHLRA